MNFAQIGLQIPTILLPRTGTDLTQWAVVACDQYTSQPDYWRQVENLVGEAPSTLRLMLPEVYLDASDEAQRIAAIQEAMRSYLARDILAPQPLGFILVERETRRGRSRKGLVAALDLEHYDYHAGAKTLIRPTEGTILERLPPRMRVRENALLELPHVMVLIDDPDRTVIEPLFAEPQERLYDFPLMLDSGRVRGWRVSHPLLIQWAVEHLTRLADPAVFAARYGVTDEPVLLYAMGDGNHSFATAKTIWENLKRTAPDPVAIMNHPARHALVELVNLHDPGLEFEAIHRVAFEVRAEHLLAAFGAFLTARGSALTVLDAASWDAARRTRLEIQRPDRHAICFLSQDRCGVLVIERPRLTLPVATLQAFLDQYLKDRPGTRLDYIHGEDVLEQLGRQPANVGFSLPALAKGDFFRTVIRDGALPRKTFSMGEADEKRFYLECRRIVS
ncbi:MAG: DUF1015 domain-containing protein [Candidatus Competibacteraceae bacterium]|nr:DUF1015 domain-containing protein [Candidatus Competibacteraceae bacterium]MBK7983222.1 DUF1015 domain-containing protein [Candidatus Competibacteraceae bacterium]MBK8898230.1 DUF1015 domain-containing protein [Candidatus Competibacteraceae bacterium]MBK8962037.1 DUF1015 domain-containing protein [Candidatus Competibacteraceae bacterium]MBK9951252.1 DUF1015 domain-containing protein [Candidatus Competibacteraceae bacterium]